MPLQHLEFLAVFEADDVVGLNRLIDRHGGPQRFTTALLRFLWLASGLERGIHGADQGRKVDDLHDILRDVGGDDIAGQVD